MKLVSVAWRVQNHVTRQRNAPATGRMLVTGAGMMDAICQHRASGPYEASARWQSVSWKISVGKLCVTGVARAAIGGLIFRAAGHPTGRVDSCA
jgi:hypothetical protein